MRSLQQRLTRRRLFRSAAGAMSGGMAAGLGGAAFSRSGSSVGLAQADASGRVRLAYYDIGEHWHSVFVEAVKPFQDANPQIELEIERRPGEQFWDKIQVEFAAETAPDITIVNMDWVVPAVARGMFVDLKPLYERDGIDTSAYWYPVDAEWGWQGGFYGGLLYAGGQAIFVNKGLLAGAGLEVPHDDWTWDDLLAYARQLTDESQNQWGVHMLGPNPPTGAGAAFIHGAGGTVLNDVRDRCTLTTPEAQAGLQFVADLILNERVMPSPTALAGQENPFLTGKVGILFGGTWDEVTIRSAGFDWDFVRMPINAETGVRSVPRDSNAWSILSTSQNQDAAWEVVKYLIGPEAQAGLMTLGLPVLKGVIDSQEFQDAHAPQHIERVVADLAEQGHDIYPTPDASEWWDAANQELSVIWSGEATVAEATERACQAIDEIFARRPPEWSA